LNLRPLGYENREALFNPGRHLIRSTGTLQQSRHDWADPGARMRACLTLDRSTAHDEYMDLGRITVDHQIMGGVPCVAGTRIPVATVVGLVANGLTTEEIIAEYLQLTPADVQACLGYAARAVDERELPVRLTA
jgi:uncharacterized protein (DUF433 family)